MKTAEEVADEFCFVWNIPKSKIEPLGRALTAFAEDQANVAFEAGRKDVYNGDWSLARKECRAEALEEAAKVAEPIKAKDGSCIGAVIAEMIRALQDLTPSVPRQSSRVKTESGGADA